jgi:hypothetical protein
MVISGPRVTGVLSSPNRASAAQAIPRIRNTAGGTPAVTCSSINWVCCEDVGMHHLECVRVDRLADG